MIRMISSRRFEENFLQLGASLFSIPSLSSSYQETLQVSGLALQIRGWDKQRTRLALDEFQGLHNSAEPLPSHWCIDWLPWSEASRRSSRRFIFPLCDDPEERWAYSWHDGLVAAANRWDDTLVCADLTRREVRIFGEETLPRRQGYSLQDVVKCLIRFHYEAGGASLIHAAGVEVDGRAVLFMGAKGTGKTTLLLSLMHRGHRFMSADRCFLLSRPDGPPTCLPWPGALRFTPETRCLVPMLDEIQRAAHRTSIKFRVPLAKLSRTLPCSIGSPLPIGKVLLLDPSAERQPWTIRPMTDAETILEALRIHRIPREPHRRVEIFAPLDMRSNPPLPRLDMLRLSGRHDPVDAARLLERNLFG